MLRGVSIQRVWSTGFGRGRRLGRVFDYLTYLAGASRVLALHSRPDVVLSLSTPPMVALLGLIGARLKRARSVYWVMDVYPELAFELGVLRQRSLGGRALAVLSRFLLRRSDRVVALGDAMAQRLRAGGAPEVSVIHNWADGRAIQPTPTAGHPLRSRWGWEGRFVVLYSGNMGLMHEFDTVLEAAALLLPAEPQVLFAFVGGGPRRPEVEARVRQLGLKNVEFRAAVARSELGQSLTSGDLHLVTLSGRAAGLLVPSKIYGVLAAGRPTLYVGPEGDVSAILRQGRCGARIAANDAAALAQEIVRYRQDERRRLEEGERARRLFEECFTKERGLRAFQLLLQSTQRARA